MAKQVLFDPEEYRDLSSTELLLLRQAYHKAIEARKKNVTSRGFSACSLADKHGRSFVTKCLVL